MIFQSPKLNRECESSIPPRTARQSCDCRWFATCASQARKSRLFVHSTLSPDSRSPNLGSEIAESLRPCPRKFPLCSDFSRRPVRSRLPPEGCSRCRSTDKLFTESLSVLNWAHLESLLYQSTSPDCAFLNYPIKPVEVIAKQTAAEVTRRSAPARGNSRTSYARLRKSRTRVRDLSSSQVSASAH